MTAIESSRKPLPKDAGEFYRAGAGIDALVGTPEGAPSALERLGPSPFPKTKFPFLGFLASVYDHVSSLAKAKSGALVDQTQQQQG